MNIRTVGRIGLPESVIEWPKQKISHSGYTRDTQYAYYDAEGQGMSGRRGGRKKERSEREEITSNLSVTRQGT